MHIRRPAVSTLTAAALITLTLAGCGSGSDDPSANAETGGGTILVKGIEFPKPEKTKIIVGKSAVDPTSMPIYAYLAENLDAEFGLDISAKQFSGTAPATQALLAGDIDVVNESSAMWVSRPAKKPVTSVFILSDNVIDVLYSKGDIQTGDDLKGKSIAVSSVGSYSYAEALLALQSLGLTEKDVTILPVGKDADRQAALVGGSVEAAILNSTIEPQMTEKGFNPLVKLADAETPGYTGLALNIPDTFRKKYPNTTLALTALYQWGVYEWLHNDVETSAKVWADVSGEPLAQATEEIESQKSLPWTPIDGRCNLEALKFQKSILSLTNEALADVDPATVCTDEYIDKLKEMGFQKALGVDGY